MNEDDRVRVASVHLDLQGKLIEIKVARYPKAVAAEAMAMMGDLIMPAEEIEYWIRDRREKKYGEPK